MGRKLWRPWKPYTPGFPCLVIIAGIVGVLALIGLLTLLIERGGGWLIALAVGLSLTMYTYRTEKIRTENMRALLICSKCQTVVARSASSCPSCYIRLDPATLQQIKLCRRDGTPVLADARFCPTCGARVPKERSVPAQIWFAGVVLMGLVVTLLFLTLRHSAYAAYQPASCVITSAHIVASGKSRRPDFTYRVLQKESRQLIGSGEGDLGLDLSGTWSDIRREIGQYPVGGTYPCWYSTAVPASPTRLLLPDGIQTGLWDSLVWFFGTLLLVFLVGRCVRHRMVYPWGLYTHLVSTQGKVVTYEYHTVRRRRSTSSAPVSILEFQTHTTPSLRCRTQQSGRLDSQSWYAVCYDWLRPAHNARVLATYSAVRMVAELVWGGVLTLFLIGIAFTFFTQLAFSL
jgi:RNA polymerase subunit RPABC4/transcription elongation factor Spt4